LVSTTQDGIRVLLGRENKLVDKMQRFLTIDQHMLSSKSGTDRRGFECCATSNAMASGLA